MTAAEGLTAARAAGVTLWTEGDALRYRGPREALTADLLANLKAYAMSFGEGLRSGRIVVPGGEP